MCVVYGCIYVVNDSFATILCLLVSCPVWTFLEYNIYYNLNIFLQKKLWIKIPEAITDQV